MNRLTTLTLLMAVSLLLSSCVSSKKHNDMIAAYEAEKKALQEKIDAAEAEKMALNEDMQKLQNNLNMSAKEIEQLSEEIKKGNEKVAKLRSAIGEAFSTYDPNDITVEERSGKLYITMANSILYKPGRAEFSKDSKDVVSKLAKAFSGSPDLMVEIEGHTDGDPVKIHRAKYKDNWSLSVARSLAIVRELVDMGVSKERLTASGKGDTQPIASNDTEEGKIKHRRTEFVVSPKISGLYKIYTEEIESSSSSEGGDVK
ncbi:MAG: OmpA family protein [Bacteroidota bacterium]